MKNLVVLIVILFSAIQVNAQDKIYLMDNTVVSAKVSEITVSDIKYKKWENLTGPDYVLPKTQVAMIIYENGTHEVMNSVVNNGDVAIIDILPYYQTGKNYLGINYFDLIYKNITLGYTRYLFDYKLSVGLNASFGFTNNDNSYNYSNSFLYFDKDYFHSVLSVNYFPVGMKKVSYFTGLSLMAGLGGDYSYDYYSPYELVNKSYYGFYVNNGVQFNLTKHFNIRTSLSLGLVDRDMNGDFQTHGLFELGAGLRF